MNKRLLLRVWRAMLPIPRPVWQREVAKSEHGGHAQLSFMTHDHHRVRDFVVLVKRNRLI